jgi:chemotaxis protein MotA
MKKFDLLTPIGILFGIIVISLSITSNRGIESFLKFIDLSSILIVLGGVIAAMFVSFSLKDMKLLATVIRQAFKKNEYHLGELINTFTHLSNRARREGLLALETEIDELDDPFMKKGILLAVDGVEQEVIIDVMNAEIAAMEERHRKGRSLLEKAGEYAPSWGMIGTLIGLVLMLNNLNDPSTLGPNMALALLTTLYGSMLANLVFLPLASKLAQKTEREVFVKQVMIEGIIGVQSGQNPKLLEEKLIAFLSSEERREKELLEMEREEAVNK